MQRLIDGGNPVDPLDRHSGWATQPLRGHWHPQREGSVAECADRVLLVPNCHLKLTTDLFDSACQFSAYAIAFSDLWEVAGIGAAKSPYEIIQKELDFAWERSVTAPALAEHQRLFRDPAPPAFAPVRGFGGGGARRHCNRTKDLDNVTQKAVGAVPPTEGSDPSVNLIGYAWIINIQALENLPHG